MEKRYGMRLRPFSIGTQPNKGLVRAEEDPTGQYHNILIYDRELTDKELYDYELDKIN